MSFADPPATEIAESQDSTIVSEAQSLVKELFGEVETPMTPSSWNHMILNPDSIPYRDSQDILCQDIRIKLLAKVRDELAALAEKN